MLFENYSRFMLRIAKMYSNIKLNENKNLTDLEKTFAYGKCGYIEIKKISKNIGYLNENDTIKGITYCFSENCSLWVFTDNYSEDFYYTSVINKIDFDKNEFITKNSAYSFSFKELTIEECNKFLYNKEYCSKLWPNENQFKKLIETHPNITLENIDKILKIKRNIGI